MAYRILSNPGIRCPPKILHAQRSIAVEYVDFANIEQTGVIEVHQELSQDVIDFFALARQIGFPIARISPASDSDFKWDDSVIMSANASTGFNFRYKTGSDTEISLHGYGRAFDINPVQNPYLSYRTTPTLILPSDATWDTKVPGTLYLDHPLVQLLLKRGWEWGGNWSQSSGRTDYQHFEKAV